MKPPQPAAPRSSGCAPHWAFLFGSSVLGLEADHRPLQRCGKEATCFLMGALFSPSGLCISGGPEALHTSSWLSSGIAMPRSGESDRI